MLERQYFLYDKCNTNERNRQTVLFYGESLRSCGKAWRRTGQKAYLLCDYFRVSDECQGFGKTGGNHGKSRL